MNARVLIVVGVCAAAGVPLGILAANRTAPPDVPPVVPPASAGHRVPLTPADMKAAQERPAVAVDSRGRLLLAWASEAAENVRTLYLARSADGGSTLTPPAGFRSVPVLKFAAMMRGKEITRTSNVLPRLAASGDTIALGWTEHRGKGVVEFLVAKSADGGATFSDPVKAHGPAAVRPTFTALAAGPDGTLACTWLDHRAGVQQPYCAVWPAGASGFGPEKLVYAGAGGRGICPCCDTEALVEPGGGVIVAFRDSGDGIREMHLARLAPGAAEFGAPRPVSGNRWKFDGCPHDGPSLALTGGTLNVLWMDAHAGRPRVYRAAGAADGFAPNAAPLDAAGAGTQGHPRLVAAGGQLHAAWDASLEDEPAPAAEGGGHKHGPSLTGAGRAILYADLTAGSAPRPIDPKPGAFQLNPALAAGPDGAVFAAWNELTEGGKAVVLARVSGR